jgi:plasmid stabilization system protein ParE
MMWKIIIEDLAQIDLHDAYHWYEKAKDGLGEEFLDSFETTIQNIQNNPFYTSLHADDYRSATLHRFPYEIIYIVDNNKGIVFIIAITHQHREPSWFRNRR